MKTYNDRPRSTALGRAGFFYSKPRIAYAVCRGMNFGLALVLSLPVWIAGFNLYKTFGMDLSGLFSYALWLGAFLFVSHTLWKNTRTLINGIDSSDIRALAELRKSSGIFWQGYGQAWVSYFPHLAERIDPATGNIGTDAVSGSKRWEILEGELESMIAQQA